MIKLNKKLIKKPTELTNLNKPELTHLLIDIGNKSVEFEIPEKLKTNTDKTSYKIGFLFYVYKFLFEFKSNRQVFERINNDFQIFLGPRQMARHLYRYDNNKIFK